MRFTESTSKLPHKCKTYVRQFIARAICIYDYSALHTVFSNVPAVCNIYIQSAQITDHQASTIAATVYSLRQQTNVLRFLKFYLYIF